MKDHNTVPVSLAAGTGRSIIVESCQVCGEENLNTILFLGYLPPVNTMPLIGELPNEQSAYPAHLLKCPKCHLVQLSLVVDKNILFPPGYPYTSGTTRILRENFAELAQECGRILDISADDLVIDIGSNDGTLLSNFSQDHRVLGIEPTNAGNLANERQIPTLISFFERQVAEEVRKDHGPAKVVTATNVFAHIEDVHAIVDSICTLLASDGVFISESHYLLPLVETVQYDTIYHEHLRYYSLRSLQYLLSMHDLEVFYAKRIPTHGGSIRVYAAPVGTRRVDPCVHALLEVENKAGLEQDQLDGFKQDVVLSKVNLYKFLAEVKQQGQSIYGIGAPSRASTLINYVGLDDGILDCVLEIQGSYKIGKYMPGTIIPVLDESRLFEDQPDFALLLSWHIADELMPKLCEKGFRGKFIIPLPEPRIVSF